EYLVITEVETPVPVLVEERIFDKLAEGLVISAADHLHVERAKQAELLAEHEDDAGSIAEDVMQAPSLGHDVDLVAEGEAEEFRGEADRLDRLVFLGGLEMLDERGPRRLHILHEVLAIEQHMLRHPLDAVVGI